MRVGGKLLSPGGLIVLGEERERGTGSEADSSASVRDDRSSTAGSTRKEQILEVLVLLFLIVPSMVISYFSVMQGQVAFPSLAFSLISRDLALVALIVFLMWRNQEPLKRLGLTERKLGQEAALGVVLFVPFFLGTILLAVLLRSAGLSAPDHLLSYLTPHGTAQVALGVMLVVVVAVAEEVLFRGYLLLRFRTLLRNTAAAVVLSTLIFALGHGYEGTVGVVTVGVMGAALSLLLLWRRSLTAPITIHFLQNLMGVVVLPLLDFV